MTEAISSSPSAWRYHFDIRVSFSENRTKGLFEARIKLGSNIWRVFCFFDKGRLVILLSGFAKKTQKTPKKEIDKALVLMKSYFEDKNK
ncbi:MAG: type II toxin-antitoxin system RelE/ParE family toxin [Bacteroidales bacterium]|nr:type II toxin-antitoxin system RelE/ParE family toxin [Bacteroidales bacterium]